MNSQVIVNKTVITYYNGSDKEVLVFNVSKRKGCTSA